MNFLLLHKSVCIVFFVLLIINNNYSYGMDNQNESLEVVNRRLMKENEELKQRHEELKKIASKAGERLMNENEKLRNSSMQVTPQLYYGVGLASVSLLVLGYLGGVLSKGTTQSK